MINIHVHELEVIFASSNPTLNDQLKLQEKYQNLLDYIHHTHKAKHPDYERHRHHTFEQFEVVPDLEALKRRIENYASIHHISLS